MVFDDLNKFIVEETNKLQDRLYDNIKKGNPVDTGLSKSSWVHKERVSRVGQVGVIYNPINYVIYLELGHSGQAPNGFIVKGIIQTLNGS